MAPLIACAGRLVGPLPVVQAAKPVTSLEAVGTGPLLGTTFNTQTDGLHTGRQFPVPGRSGVHWVNPQHLVQTCPLPADLRIQDLHGLEGGRNEEVPEIRGGGGKNCTVLV
jgi:hypothetical protein